MRVHRQVISGGSEVRAAVAVPPLTRNTAMLDFDWPELGWPPPDTAILVCWQCPLLFTSPSSVSVETTQVEGRHLFKE